jgi:methylthioribose-1-phosphate isomerase
MVLFRSTKLQKFKTIEWKNNYISILDQRKLPNEVKYLRCNTPYEVARAIKQMVIRGAPAIGVVTAMAIALGAKQIKTTRKDAFFYQLDKISDLLSKTRPTAVNLFWAIKRMRDVADSNQELDFKDIILKLEAEAIKIYKEDIEICKKIGINGSRLIKDGSTVITHCNAGALATAGYGTALGVIRAVNESGKKINVFSTETRPYFQGSRLTAWELLKEDIPVTIITDSMAGHVMIEKKISAIIVGADRIASNGDVANKIGTLPLAIMAKHNKIPFYVAAPLSTIDFECKSGTDIPIEERDATEISKINGKRIAADAKIYNPAFDVTPNKLITAIITQYGVVKKPFKRSLSYLKYS